LKIKKNHYNSAFRHDKHYNFFGDYLWDKYHTQILKLPIDARLSCPNRDGAIGKRGCIFCAKDGSASHTTTGFIDITSQMQNAKNSFRRSDAKTRYIAYFQAYSNTYAPVDKLKILYDTALLDKEVIGVMISTRPDCLSDEVLELISSYKKDNFELWLEIGMQTAHDTSLKFLNRCHTHEQTRDAILRAAALDIPICVHIILGITYETWENMMQTAIEISSLPVNGVKLHHLQIIKDTMIEELYKNNRVPMMSFREYISAICDFLERLRPDILIHRLIGDRGVDMIVAPRWGLHKGAVLKAIEDEFLKRATYQGFLYENLQGS
jgi:uncharacterized protein